MSRVFVVQNQHTYDRENGQLAPKFDLSPAKEYGTLCYLLGPSAAPFNPEGPLRELAEKLESYGDDDYLLLIGNPCLIGFAVAIAADSNQGRVKLLQWNGKERRYITITADVFQDYPS